MELPNKHPAVDTELPTCNLEFAGQNI